MTQRSSLLLIIWNVVLTALVAWGLLRKPAETTQVAQGTDSLATEMPTITPAVRDTGALKEARIAYFRLDSIISECKIFRDKNDQLRATVRNLQNDLAKEEAAAQKRLEEIMSMDAYSTQAERLKNKEEIDERVAELQRMQAEGEQKIVDLQERMARDISEEVDGYLKAYNSSAGFDYIFSVRGDGQIWVGNQDLNITEDLVRGLNNQFEAKKGKK